MIHIAILQCYGAVPSNRDFSLVSMETKEIEKATNDASVRLC
jgi:hypothetical protein